jgi:hypothetical protein
VKRGKLLKEIIKRGAVFVRYGANHDIYENRRTNVSTQVPRHNEIKKKVTDTATLPILLFVGKWSKYMNYDDIQVEDEVSALIAAVEQKNCARLQKGSPCPLGSRR